VSDTRVQSFDDAYASLIAACDEALAVGVSDQNPSSTDTSLAPELRTQVHEALACIRRLREHWQRPSQDTLAPPMVPIPQPQRIARFVIDRELGRGSFGRVYLAHDPHLSRNVALKVPRFDALAAPELGERFRREAQAAAGLDHPHIVPVFEAGEADSVCYIASAYCPGPTLAAWLKTQTDPVPHRLAAELVADLADGVQHAHDRGVLHRDLKPGNVLLLTESGTGSGEQRPLRDLVPKITDFGLAKIMSADTGASSAPGYETETGAILGTPQYMAPEQAGGPAEGVRESADIYALGAILYELLTGRPPFQADSVPELLMQLRTVDPVPVRRLRFRVPRDLDTICLKCLQKEPTKRYARAADLAADLRRFLNGEPIHARPIRWWETALKWMRRKPAIAALSLGLMTVIVGSLIGLTVLYLQAEGERKTADKERTDAIEARKQAEHSESMAKSINRFYMKDFVAAVQPKGIGRGKNVTLREALDAAVPNIDAALGKFPMAEADVLDALGHTYKALGEYERAEPLLKRAVALREEILGPGAVDTLESRLALAIVTASLGREDEAEKMERACLDEARRLHGTKHVTTLQAQLQLLHSLRVRGKLREAEKLCTEAATMAEAVYGPDDAETRRVRLNLALMAIALDDNAKAEEMLRRLWEDNKRIEGLDSAETLVVEGKLGEVLSMLGRLEEAETVLRRNIAARKTVMGDEDPGNYTIQGSLGLNLKAQGKYAEAVPLFEGTIKHYQRTIAGNVLIGFWQSHLGDTLTELGKFEDAETLLKEGNATMERHKAVRPTLEGAQRLAKLYRKWGKTDQEAIWEAKARELQAKLEQMRGK
jgi:tetratricopeptide (TPR) repeat protein